MKKTKFIFVFAFFALISFFISANVYASSFELLFNRDLPIVTSLTKFSFGGVLAQMEGRDSSVGQVQSPFTGENGDPKELRLPQPEVKMALVPAVKTADQIFLVRASTGHFFMTSRAENGSLGDVVVYAKRDWRSLPTSAGIAVDDNVFVDTAKDWRYVYRITEAVTGDQATKYLAPNSTRGSLIIVVEGPRGLEVYRGENISLQNVGQ